MPDRDPRIDTYIDNSAEFAKPILAYIRETVHQACPEVEETMKWSMPHFDYKGIMCSMASFKHHCAFGFWKASLIPEAKKSNEAMGQMGRITSLDDLPPKKELVRLIKEAARLNEAGARVEKGTSRAAKPALEVPDDLAARLAREKKAKEAFEQMPPSHRREYIEWITGAKREATRQRRIEQAIQWMSEGKSMNWKYEKKTT